MKTTRRKRPKNPSISFEGGLIRKRGNRFQAEYNIGNQRHRQTYRTIDEAQTWIKQQGSRFFRQGMSGLQLSVRDTQDAVEALSKANGRVRLVDAVNFWLEHHQSVQDSLPVRATFDRHILWMREQNLRQRSITSRISYLKPFLDEFGDVRMMELTPGEVEDHVQRRATNPDAPLSPRSIRNLKVELQAFFNWAERDPGANAGFVNRLIRFHAPARDAKTNDFARAGDVKKVLHHLETLHPPTAIAMAVACFAGLRSEELNQVRWEDVDFEQSEIRIRAETCKTRTSREIPIEPNLLAWLQKYHQASGLISPYFNVRYTYLRKAAEEVKVRWPPNGARHSYGTYYAKQFGSYSKAADNMGHVGGIKMFMSAYKGQCSKKEAAEYWKIEPSKAPPKAPANPASSDQD